MTLPDWMTRTAPPSPPAGSPPAPRLRYVVEIPAGISRAKAAALVDAFRLHCGAAAATMREGATQQALLLLAGGRVEEVPR